MTLKNISRCLLFKLLRKQNPISLRCSDSKRCFEKLQGFRKIHSESSNSNKFLLSKLTSRSIIRLHGADTVSYLQGLVTNDVSKLHPKDLPVQYSFMLNVQGRILYDLFIFDLTEPGIEGSPKTLLVDVPESAAKDIMAILKRYKLRKKVDISHVGDEFEICSQFAPNAHLGFDENNLPNDPSHTVTACPDPRVPDFGRRIIRRVVKGEEQGIIGESIYRESRYHWGLPEGLTDLPTGNCFPLESNAVFMNGVSFEKGCYIGQELTARTHYTGVTRKRLMPLVLKSSPPKIEEDTSIKTEKGRNAGKFRGSEGSFGLGLIRLAHSNETLSLTAIDNTSVTFTAHVPKWWPKEQT